MTDGGWKVQRGGYMTRGLSGKEIVTGLLDGFRVTSVTRAILKCSGC